MPVPRFYQRSAVQSGTRIVSKSPLCPFIKYPEKVVNTICICHLSKDVSGGKKYFLPDFRSGAAPSSPLVRSSCPSCCGLATFTHDKENKRRRKSVRRRSLTLPCPRPPSRPPSSLLVWTIVSLMSRGGRPLEVYLYILHHHHLQKAWPAGAKHYLDGGWAMKPGGCSLLCSVLCIQFFSISVK